MLIRNVMYLFINLGPRREVLYVMGINLFDICSSFIYIHAPSRPELHVPVNKGEACYLIYYHLISTLANWLLQMHTKCKSDENFKDHASEKDIICTVVSCHQVRVASTCDHHVLTCTWGSKLQRWRHVARVGVHNSMSFTQKITISSSSSLRDRYFSMGRMAFFKTFTKTLFILPSFFPFYYFFLLSLGSILHEVEWSVFDRQFNILFVVLYQLTTRELETDTWLMWLNDVHIAFLFT